MSKIGDNGKNSPNLFQRTLKATIVTLIVGIILLILWAFTSQVFANYPQFQTLYAIFAWAIIFFTFAIWFSDHTIFKYGFIIARPLFLIIYVAYAANGGVLTMDSMNFHFTIEFIPILALVIVICLIEIAKGILQALEFASVTPRD